MRIIKIGLLACLICSLWLESDKSAAATAVSGQASTELTRRIGGRLASGIITNQGTVKGSTSFAAPDAFGLQFINSSFAIGFGSDLLLSTTLDRVHLWGLRSFLRYYFLGNGVPLVNASDFAIFRERTRLPMYVGLDLRRYTYYFDNPGVEDFEKEGTFFNTNGQIGLEWFMSPTVSLNLELSMTLMTFAAAQEIFRIGTTSVIMGLGFDF